MRDIKLISYQRLANFLAVFSFIDMLFLPRIMYPVAIPVSLIFVVIFHLIFHKISKTEICLFIVLITSLSATLLNVSINFSAELSDGIKRTMQLCSFMLFYFFVSRVSFNENVYLKIIRIFFAWVFVLTLLYLIDPSSVVGKISNIYPESNFIQEENLLNLRFSYIFQDPNGAGYLYAILLASFLILEKNNFYKYIYIFFALFCIFVTQSRGSLLSVCVMFLAIFLFKRKYLPKYYCILFFVIALVVIYSLRENDSVMSLYHTFSNRGNLESSLGGGRFDKYIYMIENINIMPYGAGYNLFNDGNIFKPHSDLIRLNLSYGFIVMAILYSTVHPRSKEQLFVFIPFLFGFMINSMIDEYRLMCAFYILMRVVYKNDRCNEKF